MIQACGPLMVAVLAHFAFADERLTAAARGAASRLGFVGMGDPDRTRGAGGQRRRCWASCPMGLVSLSYAVGNIYARDSPMAPASASRWDSRPSPRTVRG